MKWITTNIRFPEEMYMELKMEAARRRTSFASVVRTKISKRGPAQKKTTKQLMQEMDQISKEISKQNPGINLSDKLIEMRYEQ